MDGFSSEDIGIILDEDFDIEKQRMYVFWRTFFMFTQFCCIRSKTIWDVNIVSESSKDLFGIRTLDFRFDVSNGEEPDFLTADITDYIECRPFLASEYDEKPYMPGQRYDDKLDDYCFASTKIKAVDTRASKSCSGLFLEVLGLYCNNKNYDPAEAKCAYSKSSQILKLSEEEIDSNCEKVCIAMDRAFAFLQIRCGVQSLSDVNYKLMIRLIAYIFTNDKWYGSEKVHDIIEAWYWAAIFSGEYDKDQNERFEKNLRSILETLTTKAKKYDWIITLKNNIFETPYFSDCSFLLMEKANEDRIPKEHLAKYICQFYLSRTYSDLIHDDRQINVFSKYKLEKHHIVPVGSVSKIGESTDILRKDKTNIVNSPLNYVFISDATNLEISNISLKEYEQDITASAKAALNIVNYPSVEKLNDKTTIKAWLKERYKILKGQIQNRVMNMLLS